MGTYEGLEREHEELTATRSLSVIVCADADAAASIAAGIVLLRLREADDPVFGVATGESVRTTYRELANRVDRVTDGWLDRLVIVALDEYALPGDDPRNFDSYVRTVIAGPLSVPGERVMVPNGSRADLAAEADRFERLVQQHPRSVQLAGVGVNGHLAFNEPGTPFETSTHVATLSDATLAANAPAFDDPTGVPRQAVTQGIRTVLGSTHLVVVAHGAAKASAVASMLDGPITPALPASALRTHPSVTVVLDAAAAAHLVGNPAVS